MVNSKARQEGKVLLVAIKVRWPESTCVDFFTNFELFDLQLLVIHLKLVNWLSTLGSIHRARRHPRGEYLVTIIDFGQSKQCDDQGAKDEEFARVRHFLGLAGESH